MFVYYVTITRRTSQAIKNKGNKLEPVVELSQRHADLLRHQTIVGQLPYGTILAITNDRRILTVELGCGLSI